MVLAFSTVVPYQSRSFVGNPLQRCTSRLDGVDARRNVHRRRRLLMCMEKTEEMIPGQVLNEDYDELKTDEDYIVVDGKDVEALIRQMQLNGEDALLALEDEPEKLLEKKPSDEKSDEEEQVMEYFTEENVQHMPKWARDAFEKGSHGVLEKGSWNVLPKDSKRRLHAIVDSSSTAFNDCRVSDIAVDYDVPVEFVTDALYELNVKSPMPEDMVCERMNREQMEALLNIITTFDAKDISDRYSDRTLSELAEDYDVDVEAIEQVCEDEGVYCSLGTGTRLQLTREDRVMDILLNEAPRKKPYPSLLEGLVPAAA